jgi:hypothetical protein
MNFYAGIGSRSTPPDVCSLMTTIAGKLAWMGWTLRSGHADGADYAFELGAIGRAEIFLPWPGFGTTNILSGQIYTHPAEWTHPIAQKYHPNWNHLRSPARRLHMRNVHQVLGPFESSEYSSIVICWTSNASAAGGTGQAIRIAYGFNIPVYDLGNPDTLTRFEQFVATPIDQTPTSLAGLFE